MGKVTTTPKDLYKAANKLLNQAGYAFDGTPNKKMSRRQIFFERRVVIMTPMGNGSR